MSKLQQRLQFLHWIFQHYLFDQSKIHFPSLQTEHYSCLHICIFMMCWHFASYVKYLVWKTNNLDRKQNSFLSSLLFIFHTSEDILYSLRKTDFPRQQETAQDLPREGDRWQTQLWLMTWRTTWKGEQREIPGGGSESTFPFIRSKHRKLHT